MNIITPGRNKGKKTPRVAQADPTKGLSAKKVDHYLRIVIFLGIIGAAYIWNSHLAERQVEEKEVLKKEVKALKDKYYMKEADFSAAIRYTEMVEMTDSLGLKKLTKPPYRLTSKTTEP